MEITQIKNSKKKRMKGIATVLLALLFLTFLLDPGNSIFRAKEILFGLLVLIYAFSNPRISQEELIVAGMFISVPLFGFLICGMNNGDINFAIGILSSVFIILIYPIMKRFQINGMELFSKCCFVLCLTIICLGIIALSDNEKLIDWLYSFGNKHNAFTIDTRQYGAITFPNLYFHSAPMLIVASVYYANKFVQHKSAENFVKLLIITTAFFLTGTRANMIMAIAAPAIIFYMHAGSRIKAVMIAILLVFVFLIRNLIFEFFSLSDGSNSLKISYLSDYLTAFKNNFIYFLIGGGIGNPLYSAKLGAYLNITELSYLNIIYWFGVPCGVIYIGILAYPLVVKLEKKDRYIKIILLLFLFMNTINPFIFSSNGMTIFSLVYYESFKKAKRRKQNASEKKQSYQQKKQVFAK